MFEKIYKLFILTKSLLWRCIGSQDRYTQVCHNGSLYAGKTSILKIVSLQDDVLYKATSHNDAQILHFFETEL